MNTIQIVRHGRIADAVATELPAGMRGVYQVGEAIQLDADTVGVLLNIRSCGANANDIEIGNDMMIISGLNWRKPRSVIPLSRATIGTHPEAGTPHFICSYTFHGGFVPAGVFHADGTPHPHAGHGFGMVHRVGMASDENGNLRSGGEYAFLDVFHDIELLDLEYKDGDFRKTGSRVIGLDQLLPGWVFVSMPLGMFWPDGDDMVGGMVMKRREAGALPYAGFIRFRREAKRWQAVEFIPVGPVGSYEPSIVRDTDGTWLFTARGCHEYRLPGVPEALTESAHMNDLRLWRSTDGGRSWTQCLHQHQVRACTTTGLGVTVDGTPYILGGPYTDGNTLGKTISSGEMHSDWMRERIVLWPLTPSRDRALEPVMVHDAPAEFGQAPDGGTWQVDHPISSLLYGGDRRWHNIVFHRVLTQMEGLGKAEPTPVTGTYADECGEAGIPVNPIWNFAGNTLS